LLFWAENADVFQRGKFFAGVIREFRRRDQNLRVLLVAGLNVRQHFTSRLPLRAQTGASVSSGLCPQLLHPPM